jgi:hypothetical protein
MATPTEHLTQAGKESDAVAAMTDDGCSPEFSAKALEATIRENEGMGRKRGARRSSPSGKTETRRLGDDGQRSGGGWRSVDRCRVVGVVL